MEKNFQQKNRTITTKTKISQTEVFIIVPSRLRIIYLLCFLSCILILPNVCNSQDVPEVGDKVIISILENKRPQIFENNSTSSNVIARLSNGDIFVILEKKEHWIKVELSNNQIGWLSFNEDDKDFTVIKMGISPPKKAQIQHAQNVENDKNSKNRPKILSYSDVNYDSLRIGDKFVINGNKIPEAYNFRSFNSNSKNIFTNGDLFELLDIYEENWIRVRLIPSKEVWYLNFEPNKIEGFTLKKVTLEIQDENRKSFDSEIILTENDEGFIKNGVEFSFGYKFENLYREVSKSSRATKEITKAMRNSRSIRLLSSLAGGSSGTGLGIYLSEGNKEACLFFQGGAACFGALTFIPLSSQRKHIQHAVKYYNEDFKAGKLKTIN